MNYTKTHEWIELTGNIGTVGVTDHAQKELGDIVFVELPKIGHQVKAGEEVVVLESTKAAADVYSPVSGTIIAVNEPLKNRTALINTSAETEGWLFKIELKDINEVNALLDKKTYLAMVQ